MGWRGSQHPGLSTRRWPLGTSLQPKRSAAAAADQISILFFKSTTRSFVCILIGSETGGGGCWTLLCSRLQPEHRTPHPGLLLCPARPGTTTLGDRGEVDFYEQFTILMGVSFTGGRSQCLPGFCPFLCQFL